MEEERIPFVYFPKTAIPAIGRKLRNTAYLLGRFFPHLESDLRKTNIKLDMHSFLLLIFLNAWLWFFLSAGLLFVLINAAQARSFEASIVFSLGLGLFVYVMIFVVTVRYPKVTAGKKAERIERSLVFALKDLLLQISAGIPLYDAIVNVGNSNYEEISKEFEKTAKQVQAGTPMDKALEDMALRNNSEYLKRAVWQIVNVLRSGSNLKVSLRIVINDLLQEQKEHIRGYAQELNMWSLIYMLFAVAIPTIGTTVMLIMTSFSGASMTQSTFVFFGLACLAVQYIIIGLIQSRRPQLSF